MTLVATRRASELTGLSTSKLREWTSRRALIPADVTAPRAKDLRPSTLGRLSSYCGWQSFYVTASISNSTLTVMSSPVCDKSFKRLRSSHFWEKSLAIHDSGRWSLLDPRESAVPEGDALLIHPGSSSASTLPDFRSTKPIQSLLVSSTFSLRQRWVETATREQDAGLPVARSVPETHPQRRSA